jgi:hypothetical protein
MRATLVAPSGAGRSGTWDVSNQIPQAVSDLIKARDQGRCIVCGAAGTERMHRIPRRDGGHRAANIALGCHTCHARAHASPAWGYETGIMASRYGVDLTLVPIWSWRGWVLLDDEGGYHVIAPRITAREALTVSQAIEAPREG